MHERDIYVKVEVELIMELGWRPQHLYGVRWEHLKYDAEGHPYSIVADGVDSNFKTGAPIAS